MLSITTYPMYKTKPTFFLPSDSCCDNPHFSWVSGITVEMVQTEKVKEKQLNILIKILFPLQ